MNTSLRTIATKWASKKVSTTDEQNKPLDVIHVIYSPFKIILARRYF